VSYDPEREAKGQRTKNNAASNELGVLLSLGKEDTLIKLRSIQEDPL
jgi:hypothetical protein